MNYINKITKQIQYNYIPQNYDTDYREFIVMTERRKVINFNRQAHLTGNRDIRSAGLHELNIV